MIELRWLISTEQRAGAFSEPCQLADGRDAWIRLQVRAAGMVEGAVEWQEIPVVSDVLEQPRLVRVAGGRMN